MDTCYLTAGLVLRLGMMIYGEWQDMTMRLKFTDVDYYVFTDAARYVTQGLSPYQRATYRYSPLLAWALVPNIYLHRTFGKLVFILFDVGVADLIHRILKLQGYNEKICRYCGFLWLFNPLPAAVSSRGNAESILAFLVLLTLHSVISRRWTTAAVLFAASVHLKIYPITYSLPIYLMLTEDWVTGRTSVKKWDILPNVHRVKFGVAAAMTLIALTSICYWWYGWDFLSHTYLYHVTRSDIRHNFSPYFYMLYLCSGSDLLPLVSVLVFLPQVALLLVLSWRYHCDPALCWLLHTFVFVTFNKVCTSQYFLWYLCLLPLVVPSLKISLTKGTLLLALWFAGQGVWLSPAYYLEFEGHNTFIQIWAAGVIFFIINVYIAYSIMRHYVPGHKNKMS